MGYPQGVGVVDLMIGFPFKDKKATYEYLMPGIKDAQSKEGFKMPAEYMFKETPDEAGDRDPIDTTFSKMDEYGIDKGLFGLSETSLEARKRHPGRVALVTEVDPNDVMGAVRKIRAAHADHGLNAVSMFPAGCFPQVPVDDAKMYPVYAACVELDIPVIVNAGVPGPRLPMKCQHVELFDQVCYDFPELRIVMRHGAEPWTALAVKLMLKWPGLYYMPSAFAPKHYPKDIIAYANTRGADKVMYAGYYPAGLTLDRIFTEMPNVPFKDEVWPKFLRENAMRVFKLDQL
jgi:predicted TIM-barrel fold metal-dependent hydrolase